MLAEAVEMDLAPADWEAVPDDVLVARFNAGDDSAFDVLYLRYRDRLRGVMSRFASDIADADDLVQEVFIKALRALPRFRGDCKFYTWLYQIGVNTGIKFKQRRNEEYTNFEGLDIETEIGPERIQSLTEQKQQTMRALGNLAPPLCQALLLNVVHGLEYADVSNVLDCPLGTVRSRISRARSLMAEALGE